jgi:hypothetical protein
MRDGQWPGWWAYPRRCAYGHVWQPGAVSPHAHAGADAARVGRCPAYVPLVLPHRRLTEVDERLEHAAASPVIVPETVVCDHGKAYVLRGAPAPFGELAWQHARTVLARRGQNQATEAEIAQAAAELLDKAGSALTVIPP